MNRVYIAKPCSVGNQGNECLVLPTTKELGLRDDGLKEKVTAER